MKKVHFALALVPILVGAAIFLYPWQKSSENDLTRYGELLKECEVQYKADTAAGKRFIRYPCSEDQLRTQFRQKYGHSYRE